MVVIRMLSLRITSFVWIDLWIIDSHSEHYMFD